MPARWRYRDISLEIQASLIHGGRRYTVPMYGGESLDHAMFKVSIAAHLLAWGYRWEQIHWEQSPVQIGSGLRPDLYTEEDGSLPAFWFECGGTDQEKLRDVISALPNFRVARVVDCDWFAEVWGGKDIYVVDGKLTKLEQITDRKQRKKLVIQSRESVVPPGVECWAIRGREQSPRIVFCVRREQDGQFTYLDSGEGWSLSRFPYIFNRKSAFRPLIPGLVGSEKWRGLSQGYHNE